jgi:hypothetical protein
MFHAMADFDGDGYMEAAAAYRLQDEFVVEVYKHNGYHWTLTDQWRGNGHTIHALYSAQAEERSGYRNRLVIGWSSGAGPAYWSVYEWMYGTLQETARIAAGAGESRTTGQLPLRGTALYPASVKTADGIQWGYVDPAGRMVLPAIYEYAFDFQNNGLAIVQIKDRNGVINAAGQFVVEPVYLSINPFTEGLAIVSDSGGYRVMNEAGVILTKKAYDYISAYQEGRASFSEAAPQGPSAYGYLDTGGKEVIPARYQQADDFKAGKAVVKVRDKEYALIGLNGEKLGAYPYEYVGPLSEGKMAFQQEQNGKYGYLNEQGKAVIPLQYTGAQPFQEGRAVVNTAEDYGSRYGLINEAGKFVIEPAYNEVRQLGEGRVGLGQAIVPDQPYMGSKYAIADVNGTRLTGFDYHDITDFTGGLASVNNGKETFFIDRTGKRAPGLPVVPGTGTLVMSGSLIQANVDNRLSYLDRSGRIVWEQNKIIPLTPPYRVVEHKYKPNKDYLVYYPQVEGMADPAAQRQVNAKLKELSQVKPVEPGAQLDYSYTGDFSVAFFRKELLVLELNGYNFPFGAAHGMPYRVYAQFSLVTGRFFGLKDLFKPGSDYVKVLSDIVGNQIKTDPQYSYVWPESYKGVAADQPFYVTGEALHLYFTPYEIAPYAAGFPEFVIPFREIEGILDKNGAFWKSFH